MMYRALVPAAALGVLVAVPAGAIQFADGETAFDHIPRLVGQDLVDRGFNTRGTYNVRIQVPQQSNTALGRVVIGLANPLNCDVIAPVPGSGDVSVAQMTSSRTMPVRVRVGDGTGLRYGDAVSSVARIEGSQLAVTFDEPVAPGSTVNIEWMASNPDVEATYLFDVVAYPAGDAPRGQFLGFARLNVGTNF
ncbi:DUF2808 domain-containing protein [Gloeobacter violaceus]|uniref:Glr3841 protein n=1 Tax=Gloeobacter violaceus (strain ATCC 29082 / PCC 7421) TaxID=251221 RepID=Q7NEN8_GLOVI|nr:DUF2808 domain-containing protein [Gloeobacter violaceus]BAC91782.1 glr3841 [Gloeobacter violaceus PCC 7421]